jgi:hypothetical protein
MLAQVLKCPPSPLWRLGKLLEHPGDAQRQLLRSLFERAKDTAWGRAHGFHELSRSPLPRLTEEYQSRVPLSIFSDLQPYTNRVISGESDVIWPGRPTAFAISGGTRSGGRPIPLFRETMKSLTRSSLLPGLCYLAKSPEASKMLGGKFLSLPGGIEADKIGGSMAGEVSGLLAYHAPHLLAYWLQALPQRVMLMENWDEKLTVTARLAVRQDVRAIAMVPSWAPVFFERVREVVGDDNIANAVKRVWPNLRVFFSGGVALSSYRTILHSYFGPGVEFVESYSASEGLFAFQDSRDQEGLIVNLTGGVFFEFVPVEEKDSPNPTRYTIETVKPGVDYILYVTNTGGLWSMCVEDVVQFVSTRPPRLRVMGRVGEMLDRFGDATSADHARRALAAANKASGTRSLNYHLTFADLSDSPIPRHHWVIEFDLAPGDLEAYARSLDEFMKQFNGRYRTRRDPGAMAGPVVTSVPPCSCATYLKSARQRFSGQSKIINVSEDGIIARGIIAGAREIDESRVSSVQID